MIVEPGRANDAAFVGFEAIDDDAFDARRSPASRAAGFDVTDGSTTTLRERRGRSAWRAPRARGACRSRSWSGSADAPTPFASPLVPGGFLTDGVGFGHAVFATTAFDESHRFLVEGLGLGQSDWLEMEIAAGHRARGALLPLQRAAPHRGARPRRRSSCRRGCTT